MVRAFTEKSDFSGTMRISCGLLVIREQGSRSHPSDFFRVKWFTFRPAGWTPSDEQRVIEMLIGKATRLSFNGNSSRTHADGSKSSPTQRSRAASSCYCPDRLSAYVSLIVLGILWCVLVGPAAAELLTVTVYVAPLCPCTKFPEWLFETVRAGSSPYTTS